MESNLDHLASHSTDLTPERTPMAPRGLTDLQTTSKNFKLEGMKIFSHPTGFKSPMQSLHLQDKQSSEREREQAREIKLKCKCF